MFLIGSRSDSLSGGSSSADSFDNSSSSFSGNYLAIDAGAGKRHIAEALQCLHIDPDRVTSLLLTHSDYDHVAGLPLFAHARLAMGEDELQLVNGRRLRAPFVSNHLPEGFDPSLFTLLHDGDEFDFSEHHILCIKTPGHTVGSMSYLVDDRWLFTGDAFRIKSGRMIRHPFTQKSSQARTSMRKLEALFNSNKDITAFTAHYGRLR